MPPPFWESQRAEAEAIVKLLCADSEPHTWVVAPLHELRLRALAALITRTLPKGRRIAWHVVRDVVNHCIETKKTAISDIEQAMQEAWDNGQRVLNAPKRSFRVVTPVDFARASPLTLPREFVVGGCRLRLASFETMESCLGRSIQGQDNTMHRYNTQWAAPAGYLEATVEAPIAEIAVEQFLEAATTWRAALNFWVATSSIAIQFTPGPRATVREPAWLAIADVAQPQAFDTVRFVTPGEFPAQAMFPDSALDQAESMLRDLESDAAPNSTSRLAIDAIRMFCVALDQAMWHHALFLFWQVAELLTLPTGERGNHDELCRRLVLLGDLTDEQTRRHAWLALRDIKQLRNDVAHAGASGVVHDSDIRFLDAECKRAIWWLIRNRKRFPTNDDLWAYFRAASASPEEYKRMQHVRAQIDDLRQGSGAASVPAQPKPTQPQ